MARFNHYVYIMTNAHKNVVYVGVTNNLARRVWEHEKGTNKGFTQKYNCKYLVFFEQYDDVIQAIHREKEIKKWSRKKKDLLISKFNPDWKFLNESVASVE